MDSNTCFSKYDLAAKQKESVAQADPSVELSMYRIAQLFLTILVYGALPAWGHAILLEAKPQANQVVGMQDTTIKLRFNSRIDGLRSKLELIGPDGRELAIAIEQQASPDVLTGKPANLSKGSYILRWQVLAADGHITRGEIPFQVQ
jgi:hypothetical protein